ncbi:MAG: superoxide dismutase [Microbacteriaceae bacterium]|nr:superoxide dismutase [Microbacteriaceae bacterium]
MTVQFKLPNLPYDAGALEPHISRTTMETHHGKHHAAYIKNMNAILAERAGAPASLEAVVERAKREGDKKLFNNAAQAWNHAFFWNSLSPEAQAPSGDLKAAIEKSFGSLDAFTEAAKAKGVGHFASGWLWLVSDKSGALSLTDLHDADTPITDASLTPLLVCDLWEHAYYLDYKNERPRFIDAFLSKLANWRFAEAQYVAARAGKGGWAFPS